MEHFSRLLIQLHPSDPVAVAKVDLPAGLDITLPDGRCLTVRDAVPAGHKLALEDIAPGASILRYGYRIGQATAFIQAGSWVHSHNLEMGSLAAEPPVQVTPPVTLRPSGQTFLGYRRPDGRVGTRNYIAVISTVSCSAHVVSQIARQFTPERLAGYPNVDGVIPIVHFTGCSLPPGGASYTYLRRCLSNLARHPNIAAAVYVGLGCEVMQLEDCQPLYTPDEVTGIATPGLIIQEQGGFQKTVAAGVALIERLLPEVNGIGRTPQPLSELTLALQCGGSDGWSGVTANPLVGRISDWIIQEGGAAVLGETTEAFGAEHLLTQRVTAPEVAEALLHRMSWWRQEAEKRGFSIDNNPTPGNKRGGLTTILEKSLGAVAKAGSTPLNGVLEYAELIERRGLLFMDTPGNDPVSVTGQLAGGCNLILFTTGRGSVFGSAVAPTIKIATHSSLFARMPQDMDFNAGQLLDGISWDAATQALQALVIAVASGQRTCSERNGLSENEFVPWQPDATL